VLVGAGWVLTRPAGHIPLLAPAVSITVKSNRVVEGFGEASSPTASPAAAIRSSPRVSPSRSPFFVESVPATLAHYRFDESTGTDATDASGHGWTATLDGGAAFVPGRLGNGVDLSGNSQYVDLPVGILNGAKDFTISAWVRLDSVSTWSRVFDFGTGTTVNMFLTPRSSAGTARFAITTGGNGGEQRINAPAALPSGAWTHVAVTLTAGVGILYVNRAEAARTSGMTLSPAALGNMTNCWIGRSQYRADPYLNGVVDELRIYGRALSTNEIAALP
jgi:hypothetical protein